MAQGQVTEQYGEQVVSLDIILCLDFTFEAVHFIELFGLVVASAHKEVLRVAHFPC